PAAALCAAATMLLSVAVAGADTRTVADPPNAQQADPVSVGHGHLARQRGILFHRIATRQAWVAGALGNVTLSIWVNRPARGRPDRTIVAELNEVETLPFPPTSWMGVIRDKRGRVLGHANAWQSSLRSFRIEFAKRLLGARVRYYRWAMVVTSGCESVSPPPALCGPPRQDRVPDRGSVIHRRP
ncbi:MAG: hypothetical protein M3131_10280, partial [Actinomycetota bacterium]|nr:hypothetical protein [Actinomycetota bacterium]